MGALRTALMKQEEHGPVKVLKLLVRDCTAALVPGFGLKSAVVSS